MSDQARALLEHLRRRLPEAQEMVPGPERSRVYEGMRKVARVLSALLWLGQRTIPGRGETEGRLLDLIQRDVEHDDITLRTVACGVYLAYLFEREMD